MKTFRQYYLNEVYYQILDEDLDKATDFIYDKFKEIIKNKTDHCVVYSLWKYDNNEKKPRLLGIRDNTFYRSRYKFGDKSGKISMRFVLSFNISNFVWVDGITIGNSIIKIDLNIKSFNYFVNNEKEIKFKIKYFLIHELTHVFDYTNYPYNSWERKFVKLKYKLDKLNYNEKNYSPYRLKQYRTVEETNAMIHQLIYTYKQLQKENYPDLKNISLFELIGKTSSPRTIIFTIISSPKLQKEYLIRLNREGIPIRRIGTSKYTFKELRDLINSDPENDNIENDIRIKKYYLSLRRKGYKIEDIIEKMRDRRNYENYKDYKNYKKNYRKNTKIIKEMVF
jgi:hypothetical protein